MGERIGRITIVGGGTAGWLTALLLQTGLKSAPGVPGAVEIHLIESPNIATVGVGEATVPSMPLTLRQAGISEPDFFRTCNASFKLGVLFDNWNVDATGRPIGYINPFTHAPAIDGVDIAEYYLRFGAGKAGFSEIMAPATYLWRALKGPRPLNAPQYDSRQGFAYHLDAGRFAGMLAKVCKRRGVTHIRDDVVDVVRAENGNIAELTLKEAGAHPVELVIDCTGFRGLLINGAMAEPFLDYSRYLANDRALAVQIPHPDATRIEPVTRSTALGAGWAWRVPLYHRVGTGYVFSSAHRTDDEAREEFLAHLGAAGKGAEPRVIPMRIGRTRNSWAGNCVAIGLSGGFIEPLESTAIFMIDQAVRSLLDYFPDSDFAEPPRAAYNRAANRVYDEVLDFVCLHYRLGNRTDSQYWIDTREALEMPDSLATKLELWRTKLPSREDLGVVSLFGHWTHQVVLLGKQVYGTGYGPGPVNTPRALDARKWKTFLNQYTQNVNRMLAAVADHRALLDELRGVTLGAPGPAPKIEESAIL